MQPQISDGKSLLCSAAAFESLQLVHSVLETGNFTTSKSFFIQSDAKVCWKCWQTRDSNRGILCNSELRAGVDIVQENLQKSTVSEFGPENHASTLFLCWVSELWRIHKKRCTQICHMERETDNCKYLKFADEAYFVFNSSSIGLSLMIQTSASGQEGAPSSCSILGGSCRSSLSRTECHCSSGMGVALTQVFLSHRQHPALFAGAIRGDCTSPDQIPKSVYSHSDKAASVMRELQVFDWVFVYFRTSIWKNISIFRAFYSFLQRKWPTSIAKAVRSCSCPWP